MHLALSMETLYIKNDIESSIVSTFRLAFIHATLSRAYIGLSITHVLRARLQWLHVQIHWLKLPTIFADLIATGIHVFPISLLFWLSYIFSALVSLLFVQNKRSAWLECI